MQNLLKRFSCKDGAEGMAAPGTTPERFVMVGADSDAAPTGEHRTCRKNMVERNARVRSGFSAVVGAGRATGNRTTVSDSDRELVRLYTRFRGSGELGFGLHRVEGSGGNHGSGVYRSFTVQNGGVGTGSGTGVARTWH